MSNDEMTLQDVIFLSRERPSTVEAWIESKALKPMKIDDERGLIFSRSYVEQFLERFRKLQDQYGSEDWKYSVLW